MWCTRVPPYFLNTYLTHIEQYVTKKSKKILSLIFFFSVFNMNVFFSHYILSILYRLDVFFLVNFSSITRLYKDLMFDLKFEYYFVYT